MQVNSLMSPANSDSISIAQSLAGDQSAFAQLTQKYRPQLLRFIRARLQPAEEEETEDVLQHVWLQLYLYLSVLNTQMPIRPWLFRVAMNRCRDVQRAARRKRTISFSRLEQETATEGGGSTILTVEQDLMPDAIAEYHDLQYTIEQAIEQLPELPRKIVFLRYKRQMSFIEIGRQLNISVSTAKTSFHRARQRLSTILQHEQIQVQDALFMER
jgi:RNA polymerase sigma factor (sigma-70 family)